MGYQNVNPLLFFFFVFSLLSVSFRGDGGELERTVGLKKRPNVLKI